MNNKFENYLTKILKYGLYAILLTPLVFWPRALYGFMAPKFILFQILVEIVFVIWLILQLSKQKISQLFKFNLNNWLIIALASFIAVSFISAIFGIDFSRSFWGIGARMTGLFAELHFFIWFLILISASNISKFEFNMERYINFSFAVSVFVALTAFYTNLDWRLVPGYTVFSNPTFVAPYFLFHFFWGLYQTVNRKWFFSVGSVLVLIALFLGQIRGAVIGLVAGILFLGVFLVFSNVLNRRKRIMMAIFYLLILLGVIFFWQWRNTSFIQSIGILKKFSEISTSSATVQTRLLMWQSALKGFKSAGARIAFGVGPENFNYLFNKYYNPHILMFGGGSFAETWQDKPHNAFLEILTETGLIGSLFYLLIWLTAFFMLFKLLKSGQKFLPLILMAAFISYLVLMLFSFDSFGSWFGLYLFLAFLASNKIFEFKFLNFESSSNNSILRYLAILIIISPLLWINYSIFRANIADADALRIFPRDAKQGIILFKKSLSFFTPYESEYQFDLIASVAGAIERGMPIPDLEKTINFMLQESDKAVAAHPKDAAKYTDMARIYNILGTKGRDPEILAQAEFFGEKSLELSQQRQETLYYLARTALLKNDASLAVNLAKQAVSVDPGIKQSHWYLGLAYIADNRRQEGIIEIKKALELGYKSQNNAEEMFIKNLGL